MTRHPYFRNFSQRQPRPATSMIERLFVEVVQRRNSRRLLQLWLRTSSQAGIDAERKLIVDEILRGLLQPRASDEEQITRLFDKLLADVRNGLR